MSHIKRKDIQRNLEVLFVFGDNDLRKGKGGMAKDFRGEPNSIGIRVKKKPARTDNSYYLDEELVENCRKIDEDVEAIQNKAKEFCAICIPDGIGTGLARLDRSAPLTYGYLRQKLEELKKIYK